MIIGPGALRRADQAVSSAAACKSVAARGCVLVLRAWSFEARVMYLPRGVSQGDMKSLPRYRIAVGVDAGHGAAAFPGPLDLLQKEERRLPLRCESASSLSGSALSASTHTHTSLLSELDVFYDLLTRSNRHSAMHGCGTMASSSGSNPKTSQKPHSPGTPNFHRKGFRTSGFDSRGSQPMGLFVLSAIVVV